MIRRSLQLALLLLFVATARAAEHHGTVTFNNLPVPGVTVIATSGAITVTAITDQQGLYTFPDLAPGAWTVTLQMQLFAPQTQQITITPDAPADHWELKLLPTDQIMAQATLQTSTPANIVATAATTPTKPTDKAPEAPRPSSSSDEPRPSDGFLINGSSNNAATSQFSLDQAFGNSRTGRKNLYTGGLALILGDSVLDARPYSITGLESPKPSYSRVTGVFSIGGPIYIPHFIRRGPNFFVGYQWTRDNDSTSQPGLVPTLAQRSGILPTGQVPVTPQAAALLTLYPLPNVTGNALYNYQFTVANSTHTDALQTRLDKNITRKDNLYGRFDLVSTRASNTNLFAFKDTTSTLGINSSINLNHRFSQRLFANIGYRFSRQRTTLTPFFTNRQNISGASGISGNDQSALNWGPPTLQFASGIASLTDGIFANNRNRTDALSLAVPIYRGRHNITLGADFRRQEFNVFSQQNPRGTFAFTGPNGSDFASFLQGLPDTSALNFGNPDKYLRQSVYDAFATDDWRLRPDLTINAGVRWEYGAPLTELHNRLVNLDVANLDVSAQNTSPYAAVSPVLASNPTGPLTKMQYPTSLIRPTKNRIEPRIGVSWRPIPGSTLVVRAGYGVYSDTSVYRDTTLLLAQQAPLSLSLAVARDPAACPITLAAGFLQCGTTTPQTFAVDPNFRVGYAQTWQLLVQRDLPGSFQATATYLGVKGTRGVQEFLPNTYPLGGVNRCPSCPSGFIYRASNGDSTRESGQFQLRRRLRAGLTASASYTFSKSIDNDSQLGGQGAATSSDTQSSGSATIAQDWRNLRAERGLSTFDQRHLLTATAQYTSGQGLGGGALLGGWRGRLLKEWTIATQITAGSGLPQTPIYFATTPGSGITGTLRPNYTGANRYASTTAGQHLNPAAYTAPTPGLFGSAGRNSIYGPGQFTMDSSISRTFRLKSRFNLDTRLDTTNSLNRRVFTGWNTIINNTQYGLPLGANPMRSLQITARLRF